MEGHVPEGLVQGPVPEAHGAVDRRQVRRQAQDGVRIAREAALAVQAVPFEHHPVRPQVAEIGHHHRDAARAGDGDGRPVQLALLAEEHHVGDAVLAEEALDECRPCLARAAEVDGSRAAPEQPVPGAGVDAPRRVAALAQPLGHFREEPVGRTLKEQEPARRRKRGRVHGISVATRDLASRMWSGTRPAGPRKRCRETSAKPNDR